MPGSAILKVSRRYRSTGAVHACASSVAKRGQVRSWRSKICRSPKRVACSVTVVGLLPALLCPPRPRPRRCQSASLPCCLGLSRCLRLVVFPLKRPRGFAAPIAPPPSRDRIRPRCNASWPRSSIDPASRRRDRNAHPSLRRLPGRRGRGGGGGAGNTGGPGAGAESCWRAFVERGVRTNHAHPSSECHDPRPRTRPPMRRPSTTPRASPRRGCARSRRQTWRAHRPMRSHRWPRTPRRASSARSPRALA